METLKECEVEITSKGKFYYFDVLEYFYEHMSYANATKKSEELYSSTLSLRTMPERGQLELSLKHLNKEHRYIIYHCTSRRTIKIIYFLDKKRDVVYVTDFFPTEQDDKKIKERNI